MLRAGNMQSLRWSDKTMSVLRANRLEACEKSLAGLPSLCLFDAGCTDTSAETLFANSYYADDESVSCLHTVSQLRENIVRHYPAELALLSPDEHELVVRLALFGGCLPLQDWNDMEPAYSLVRRLWCKVKAEQGKLLLIMPHQLCTAALLLLAGDDHRKARDQIDQADEMIENALYLYGIVQENIVVSHLDTLLHDICPGVNPILLHRFISAGYDCAVDRSGHTFLIHSGLAEPDNVLSAGPGPFVMYQPDLNFPSEIYHMLEDLENPIYDRLLSLISDALRPEISSEDAAEDLIILAKQNVPLSDMKEVLSSMLICLPSPEMISVLDDMHNRIPRWFSMNMSKVQ